MNRTDRDPTRSAVARVDHGAALLFWVETMRLDGRGAPNSTAVILDTKVRNNHSGGYLECPSRHCVTSARIRRMAMQRWESCSSIAETALDHRHHVSVPDAPFELQSPSSHPATLPQAAFTAHRAERRSSAAAYQVPPTTVPGSSCGRARVGSEVDPPPVLVGQAIESVRGSGLRALLSNIHATECSVHHLDHSRVRARMFHCGRSRT